MGIELAKAFITVRADNSRLPGDLSRSRRTFSAHFARLAVLARKAGSSIARGLVRASVALVGVGVGATKLAFNFQDSMAAIRNLVLDMSDKDFKKLEDGVRSLSVEFGRSTADIASGMFEMLSAGADSNTVLEDMKKIMPLVVAGNADMGESMKLVGTIISGYNLKWSDSGKIVDNVFKINEKGVTTITALAGAMGFVVDLAGTLGVSFDELSAALATATKGAPTTSVAVTRLAALMAALAKGTDDVNDLFKKNGQRSGEAAVRNLGLAKSAQILFKEAKKSGDAVGFLTKLLGRKEAVFGVLAIAGPKAQVMANNMDAMAESAGTAAAALKNKMAQGVEKFRRAMQQLLNVLREVGLRLMPVVVRILDKFSKMLGNNADVIATKLVIAIEGLIEFVKEAGIAIHDMLPDIIKFAKESGNLFKALSKLAKPDLIDGLKAIATVFVLMASAIEKLTDVLTKLDGVFEKITGRADLTKLLSPAHLLNKFIGPPDKQKRQGAPVSAIVDPDAKKKKKAKDDQDARDKASAEKVERRKAEARRIGGFALDIAREKAERRRRSPAEQQGIKARALADKFDLAKENERQAGREFRVAEEKEQTTFKKFGHGPETRAASEDLAIKRAKLLELKAARKRALSDAQEAQKTNLAGQELERKNKLVLQRLKSSEVAAAGPSPAAAKVAATPLLEPGRAGFREFGASIQDALLRTKDETDKKLLTSNQNQEKTQMDILTAVREQRPSGALT